MPSIWFTGDSHFRHTRILELCGRPFSSIGEMDETIIQRWNARVKPNDTVYHLGDFAWKNVSQQYLARLNGQIHLIRGNHDKTVKDGFSSISDMLTIDVGGMNLVLCHYPIEEWNGFWRGAKHLHGHCHGRMRQQKGRLDVGVDSWDFAPVSLDEIKEKLGE